MYPGHSSPMKIPELISAFWKASQYCHMSRPQQYVVKLLCWPLNACSLNFLSMHCSNFNVSACVNLTCLFSGRPLEVAVMAQRKEKNDGFWIVGLCNNGTVMLYMSTIHSQPRLLDLILLNLIVRWPMGAAIVRPPNTKYTQSIGVCLEKLPKIVFTNNITAI